MKNENGTNEGNNNGKIAVGYLRCSTDKQETSTKDQRTVIQRYADKEQISIVMWYCDEGISGDRTDKRRDFQRMITDAEQQNFEFVLTYDLSRFARADSDEIGHYRYLLRKSGVEVISVTEPIVSGEHGDLIRPFIQMQNHEYLRKLAKDTVRGQRSRLEEGFGCTGRPPYGFDRLIVRSDGSEYCRVRYKADGLKIVTFPDGRSETIKKWKKLPEHRVTLVPGDPDHTDVVPEIFRLYVEDGHGLRGVANILNDRSIPSPTGRSWTPPTIEILLRNPSYTGDHVWNRRTVGKYYTIASDGTMASRPNQLKAKSRGNDPSQWIYGARGTFEGLVSRELWDRAQEVFSERHEKWKQSVRGPRTSQFLLSGMLKCVHCGYSYTGIARKGKRRYYVCGGNRASRTICERHGIRADLVEEVVLDHVRGEWASSLDMDALIKDVRVELQSELPDPEVSSAMLKKGLADIDRRVETLLDLIEPENADMINGRLRALKAEKQAIQREMNATENASATERRVEQEIRRSVARVTALQEGLDSATMAEKRELVRLYLGGINVYGEKKELELGWYRSIGALPIPEGSGFKTRFR